MSGGSRSRCLLCGHDETVRLHTIGSLPLFLHAVEPGVAAGIPRLPFHLGGCTYCGHLQQVDGPAAELVETVYTKLFGSYQSAARTGIGGLRASRFLEFLGTHTRLAGRALEVGCFDGYFLSLLKARGLDVIGCDPSPGSRASGEALGVEIRQEFYRPGMYPEGAFDLFVARQVFEHITGAREFLAQARGALRVGGHLALELPDAELWLGEGVLGSLFHEHVSYYTEAVLTAAVDAAGFAVVGLEHRHTDLFLVARRLSSTAVEKLMTNRLASSHGRALVATYRSKTASVGEPLHELVRETHAAGGRVFLYGAGVHSSSMVAAFGLTPAHVDGVLDDSPASQGKVLPNLARVIESPAVLDGAAARDVVLVSGFSFQEEMLARLGQRRTPARIATLYPELRVLVAAGALL